MDILPALLFFLIILLAPILIYLDAAHHSIGRVKEKKFSIPAGAWAFLGAIPFLNILVIITYVLSRQALIRRAKSHPVILSREHKIGITLMIVLAALAGLAAIL